MKRLRFLAFGLMTIMSISSYAQKTISEGTITYDITIQPKNNGAKASGNLNGAKLTVYLKGGLSRTEMTSSLGTETTLHNSKTGNAAILKEYSGQKLMITLTREDWENRNKKFNGITFENSPDTKVIQGYTCKHAIAKLKDGTSVSVYYAPDLIAINKDYSQAFRSLPGFPMQYELETAKLIFKYTIASIDLSALAISKFDFPKSGYRFMTYEENKKGRSEED
ncbi:MAG: hypothetical protein JWP81_5092 [Ferruginibacter sp.]|nr:hypothetical protein [Ferruginibacter sp.]